MIIRPYGSEKFDKPGFETFYETVSFSQSYFFAKPSLKVDASVKFIYENVLELISGLANL